MDNDNLKDMTIEYLNKTQAAQELKKAFALYEKAQTIALSLSNIGSPDDLTITKIGTVLSLDICGAMFRGKKPSDLSEDDWKAIASDVTDKAIIAEDRDYSVYVFDAYADYIDFSAEVISRVALAKNKADQSENIRCLSAELREKKDQLLNGDITETEYIDNCMWICLDAMIKCLSAYMGCFTSDKVSEFIQAASSFAFEYGRLKLYREEQALLDEYLQNQYMLDDQLAERFEEFKAEIQAEADRFNGLINNAFDPDFRQSLIGSVDLARAAGVAEDEILHDVDEIDEFFM